MLGDNVPGFCDDLIKDPAAHTDAHQGPSAPLRRSTVSA